MQFSVRSTFKTQLGKGWSAAVCIIIIIIIIHTCSQASLWGGLLQSRVWENPEANSVRALLSQTTLASHNSFIDTSSRSTLNSKSPIIRRFTMMNTTASSITSSSLVCDRYVLGGPGEVRGFQYAGLGPRAHTDALGGDLFLAAALHLYSPLPFHKWRQMAGNAVKTHFFVTGGSLIASPSASSPSTWLHLASRLSSSLGASCGAGLTIATGPFNIEINFCYPFKFSATDIKQTGPQISVGLRFL